MIYLKNKHRLCVGKVYGLDGRRNPKMPAVLALVITIFTMDIYIKDVVLFVNITKLLINECKACVTLYNSAVMSVLVK
jgi:hypothetical protein